MSNIKITKLADFGSAEPWVARVWITLKEFINFIHLANGNKVNTNNKFDDLCISLSQTFLSLRNLRKSASDENIPILTLQKEYFDFYDKIWITCKDRLQKLLEDLDFDIGFYFQKDKVFKSGLEKFVQKYNIDTKTTDELIKDREWINFLSIIRNKYLQHKSFDKDIESEFFTLQRAEIYFHNVWTFIEDIILLALEQHLSPFQKFQEIEEDKRDPAIPRRFKMILIKQNNENINTKGSI